MTDELNVGLWLGILMNTLKEVRLHRAQDLVNGKIEKVFWSYLRRNLYVFAIIFLECEVNMSEEHLGGECAKRDW